MGKKTVSDYGRDVAAANPRRDTTSATDLEGDNARHIATYKFDKGADEAAKAQYLKEHPLSVINTLEGHPIESKGRREARIKAQVESHKKRGY